jgi:hypothetical protein
MLTVEDKRADSQRADDHYRIAPVEESREHREADASRVIHPSGFDTPPQTPGELPTKEQAVGTYRRG